MVRAATWLSITPEPERELPAAVATMVHGCAPQAGAVAAETARIERLILRGSQRAWLRYLHRVLELIDSRSGSPDADVQLARERALDVLANHHNLLLGLRGRGAELTASDRARVARVSTALTEPEGEP
jgi:hypothetical protein